MFDPNEREDWDDDPDADYVNYTEDNTGNEDCNSCNGTGYDFDEGGQCSDCSGTGEYINWSKEDDEEEYDYF